MLAKLIRLPLRAIPSGTVMPTLSGITKGMKWVAGAHTHGCWLGSYERGKQRIVQELIKPGMTVVDVGANAGFYTLAFSALVGDTGRVWAIEPFAENVRNLMRHLKLNGLRNVTVVQCAVSDDGGLAHFRVGPNNAQGALSTVATELMVPTLTLDSLGITPDVVKIDIEGGELAALRGAARLLAGRKTTWLVALDDPRTAVECRRVLLDSGHGIEDFAPGEIVARPAAS